MPLGARWIAFLFAAVLFTAPLFYGANRWWALIPLEGATLLIFLMLLYRHAPTSDPEKRDASRAVDWAAFLFLGIALVACLGSFYPYLAVQTWLHWFSLYAACRVARYLAAKGFSHTVALAIMGAGLVQVFLALLQTQGVIGNAHWDPPEFAAGSFVNHNHFAAYIAMGAAVALCLAFKARFTAPRGLALGAATLVLAGGVVMSLSRGAWLGLLFQVAALVVLLRPSRKIRAGLWILLLAGFGGFLLLAPEDSQVLARGRSVLHIYEDHAIHTRFGIWQGTMQMIQDQPFLGVGPGCFATAFPQYRPAGLPGYIGHAHNEFLELTAEVGIFGLLALLILAGLVFTRGIRIDPAGAWCPYRVAAAMAILGLSVHGMTDFNLRVPAIAFALAALIGLSVGEREDFTTEHTEHTEGKASGGGGRVRFWSSPE